MAQKQPGLETIALHVGQESPDSATTARAVPIYATASYVFPTPERAANLFGLKEFGNIYSRIMNPTNDVLEQRIAAIEGGVAALVVASGQAATTLAILNLTDLGDEIVSANNLYGGTYQLLHYTLERLGRHTIFVDSDDPAAFKKAITPKTKAIYVETIGNPKLDVPDFEAISKIAHDAGIPVIVDNTVGIGFFRPFEHGADIEVISTTKYVGGHGTTVGGAIVDSGKFKWNNGKFPVITDKDPSYHGLSYWDAFHDVGGANLAYILRARVLLLRDLGPAQNPFASFLLLQGIEDLPLTAEETLRECARCREVPREAPEGQVRVLLGPGELPQPPDCQEISQGHLRRPRRLRDQGRRGSRQEVHPERQAGLAPREHRRREDPRDTPGIHDASAADPRRNSSRPVSPRAWSGSPSA